MYYENAETDIYCNWENAGTKVKHKEIVNNVDNNAWCCYILFEDRICEKLKHYWVQAQLQTLNSAWSDIYWEAIRIIAYGVKQK